MGDKPLLRIHEDRINALEVKMADLEEATEMLIGIVKKLKEELQNAKGN